MYRNDRFKSESRVDAGLKFNLPIDFDLIEEMGIPVDLDSFDTYSDIWFSHCLNFVSVYHGRDHQMTVLLAVHLFSLHNTVLKPF